MNDATILPSLPTDSLWFSNLNGRTDEVQLNLKKVSRYLAIEGADSLGTLTADDLRKRRYTFFPNAQDIYRGTRRILALLDFDRILEERDFAKYRSMLDKHRKDLLLSLNAARAELPDLKNDTLSFVQPQMQPDPLSGLETWNANVQNLAIALEQLSKDVDTRSKLLGDDEFFNDVVDELRRITNAILGRWGTWQRRIRHSIDSGVAAWLALLCVTALRYPALFGLVPVSEWSLANLWILATAGIFGYVFYGAGLRLRLRL